MTSDMYGALLCPIVDKVIPRDIALQYHRQCKPNEYNDVDKLVNFLKSEVEGRERLNIFCGEETINGEFEEQATGETRFPSNSAFAVKANMKKCAFCNGEHLTWQCAAEMSAEKRKALAMKFNLCFRCLTRGHSATFRHRNIMCEKCGRHHNTLICADKKDEVEENRESECANKNEQVEVDDKSATRGEEQKMLSIYAKQNPVLPTFLAKVIGAQKLQEVRCVIDTGSDRSFVLRELVDELKIPMVKREQVTLTTFNKASIMTDNFPIHACEIQSADEKCSACLDLISINNICAKTEVATVDEMVTETIHVLIGVDCLQKILINEENCAENAIKLFSTRFGDVILPAQKGVNAAMATMPFDAQGKLDAQTSNKMRSLSVKSDKKFSNDKDILRELDQQMNFIGNANEFSTIWRSEQKPAQVNFGYVNDRLRVKRKCEKENVVERCTYLCFEKDEFFERFQWKRTKRGDELKNAFRLSHEVVESTRKRLILDATIAYHIQKERGKARIEQGSIGGECVKTRNLFTQVKLCFFVIFAALGQRVFALVFSLR